MKLVPFIFNMAVLSAALFAWMNNAPFVVQLTLEIESPQSDFGQLFWKIPRQTGFEEATSQHFALQSGTNTYRIQIPSNTSHLRLDPRMSPGGFRIHNVSVLNSFFLPLARWSPGDGGLEPKQQVANLGTIQGELQSQGDDPILYLTFWGVHSSARAEVFNFLFSILLGAFLGFVQLFFLNKFIHAKTLSKPLRSNREQVIAVSVVGLTFIFGLAGVEFGFRQVVRHRFEQLQKSADARWEIKSGKLIGYQFPEAWRNSVHAGNLREKGQFSFRINQQGYRGNDWNLESDVPRILVLGDSYSFGWGVTDFETYPSYLQKYLDRSSQKYQVLNAGVPGYGTLQELGVLEDWIQIVKPQLVLLGYVMNDAQAPAPVPMDPRISYRFASSWVTSELREWVNTLFPPEQPRVETTKFAPRANYLLDHASYAGQRAVVESLELIAKLCRRHKVPLSIAILPDFTENFDQSYRYRPIHEQIAQVGARLGVPTVDLLHRFEGMRSQQLRVPDDGHPNAQAHHLIAKFLSEDFERRILSAKP